MGLELIAIVEIPMFIRVVLRVFVAFWRGKSESNRHFEDQNFVCYRYTIPLHRQKGIEPSTLTPKPLKLQGFAEVDLQIRLEIIHLSHNFCIFYTVDIAHVSRKYRSLDNTPLVGHIPRTDAVDGTLGCERNRS